MALSRSDKQRIKEQWERLAPQLDPTERTLHANALRVAADQYEHDAKEHQKTPRVAARFKEQCDRCRLVADCIEP
jgi:hypothetical protein